MSQIKLSSNVYSLSRNPLTFATKSSGFDQQYRFCFDPVIITQIRTTSSPLTVQYKVSFLSHNRTVHGGWIESKNRCLMTSCLPGSLLRFKPSPISVAVLMCKENPTICSLILEPRNWTLIVTLLSALPIHYLVSLRFFRLIN